jgi:nicotinic acid phosphoribosyltransferase
MLALIALRTRQRSLQTEDVAPLLLVRPLRLRCTLFPSLAFTTPAGTASPASPPRLFACFLFFFFWVARSFLRNVHANFSLHIRRGHTKLRELEFDYPFIFSWLSHRLDSIGSNACVPSGDAMALSNYGSTSNISFVNGLHAAPVSLHSSFDTGSASASSIIASSATETTATQLVQEATILAQVQKSACKPDRTERLANSLAKLVHSVARLNSELPRNLSVVLFAGRRCSDRAFLLLQNLFCMRNLSNYAGTSAVLAVRKIDSALARCGYNQKERGSTIKRLSGTHAHEQVSAVNQLLSHYDDHGPVTPLLAHLLFFAVHGVKNASALPDTFGSISFARAAAAAELPTEFIEDIRTSHGDHLREGSTVLELLQLWRIDSGHYRPIAEEVVRIYEEAGLEAPHFMHSNIDSIDDAVNATSLPEAVRPTALGFGSILDGYLPFGTENGQEERLELSSIVMKCVQARPNDPNVEEQLQPLPCADKVSDDNGKEQMDPSISDSDREFTLNAWHKMRDARDFDSAALSKRLAQAYNVVARLKLLN